MAGDKLFMVLDYETFSESPLPDVGAYNYARHKSTEILCAAFRIGTRATLQKAETKLWVPSYSSENFSELLRAFRDPSINLVAHNALFEQLITRYVFGKKLMASKPELQTIPIERWHCTAATARSFSLAGKLETVAEQLKLTNQKDKEGHALMLKFSKPKKDSYADPFTRRIDPEEFGRLVAYCKRDTDTEVDLFLKLPMMSEINREGWLQDQRMNLRGFEVNRDAAKKFSIFCAGEQAGLAKDFCKLTKGKIQKPSQGAKLLVEVNKYLDLPLENLQKETIEEALENPNINEYARKLLTYRQLSSKAAVSKFDAFYDRGCEEDLRARDNTLFFGAHTGRQSGTGLQPQNLFKSSLKFSEVKKVIAAIESGDFDTIREIHENPLVAAASCLRSMIRAPEGKNLFIGDWANIETRVEFWLAEHEIGLEALRSGRDLYCEMAEIIFGVSANVIREGYKAGQAEYVHMRQLGKQVVLGAGYGIGKDGKKFLKTCLKYGVKCDIGIAQKAIAAYRSYHAAIPKFWTNLENAVFKAMRNEGKAYTLGHLTFYRQGPFLKVKLPSGRVMHYHRPALVSEDGLWGTQVKFTYEGLNLAKKPVRVSTWGGKIAENVTQAVSYDILMSALLRLEKQGEFLPVLAVHDEIVCEGLFDEDFSESDLNRFLETMGENPEWATGLPLKVEGWNEPIYRK